MLNVGGRKSLKLVLDFLYGSNYQCVESHNKSNDFSSKIVSVTILSANFVIASKNNKNLLQ